MNLLLIAALLCPTAAQVEDLEVFELVAECPMPLDAGWVITPDAYRKNAARIAGLDVKLDLKVKRLGGCRDTRDGLSMRVISLADANLKITNRLLEHVKAEDPPSRLAWAGVGLVTTLISVAVVAYFDD